MVVLLAKAITLDVTCSCHQKPSNGKRRMWWLAPPCNGRGVCLLLGESAGRNQGHGFEQEREVVICRELILCGIVNGFFFTIRIITLYRGIWP
jgi:hypothetical protein